METTRIANTDMAAAWDGPEGAHWATYADHYESVGHGYWLRLLDHVRVPADAMVLDVGCGTGRSTRDLAAMTSRGEVVGIDLSSRMLELARERARDHGLSNVRFEQGDAEVFPFPPAAFDVAISVFGAMFFGRPIEAFANIRTGMAPGGTLALLAWRELSHNDWLMSIRGALSMGRPLPYPPPNSPGPFGLADPEHVRRVLGDAGFVEIGCREVDETMAFGRDQDDAYAFMTAMGVTKGLTRDLDPDTKAQALGNLRRLIADHHTPDGVLFGSAAWLITARVPPG